MQTEPMVLIVGEDFPVKAPDAPNGGGVFEILPAGDLMLTIQYPRITPEEMAAAEAGFTHYGIYLDSSSSAAILTWKYPAPIGFLETPFHAGIYQDDRIQRYLDKAPRENNALTTVVLDCQKIVALRVSGLMYGFVEELFRVVLKQSLRPTTTESYAAALTDIYRKYDRKAIYERGRSWRHHEPA